MFFPPQPLCRPPLSAEYDVQRAIRELQSRMEIISRYSGVPRSIYEAQVAGGTMPAQIPGQRFTCWGKIRSDEDSGSGSGTGSGTIQDFVGAGFIAPDGFVAYSFDQVYDDHPWTGTVIPGGIRTSFTDDNRDGVNFAYPPPPYPDFEIGDVVFLVRSGKHWTIVGSARASFGSGGGAFSVTCPNGETQTVHVSNG